MHDCAYLELADLDAGEYNAALAGQEWTRGLLIRRKIVDGDLAFFTTWAPHGTTIERLTKIEGHRWAIEDSFETTKNELGLDHNETRSWHTAQAIGAYSITRYAFRSRHDLNAGRLQFQKAKAPGAKIIDAMHAPICSATAWLADAASIHDAHRDSLQLS